METNPSLPVEHQHIPVNHRGLHDFLYSSDDEHSASEVTTTPELANKDEQVMPLATWCEFSQNAKVAGVYAVLDTEQRTQYVGYSRNVLLALNSHVAQNGQQTCTFVRVQTFKYPKRTEMEAVRDAWLSALDSLPPGNGEMSQMWAGTVGEAAQAVMSADERNAYEEKKLKLRKAMADTVATESEAMDASATERHQKLEAAVKNDDWSSVINESEHQSQPPNI